MLKLPDIGKSIMPRVSFGEALVEIADEYKNMIVFDADVCASTQTIKFRETYPDRFYQMGIAEANMVGTAAGMAVNGFTPFVSTFAVFLAKRALDQIRVSVAYPNLNVKMNGAYGGLPTGKAGATHSSVEDIAIMRSMPNMKVLVPGDPLETKMAVELSLQTPGPVYLRTVRCPVPVIFPHAHKLEWGKGKTLSEGRDAAVLSTGMMTPVAMKAVSLLKQRGIKVRHIHLASLKPADSDIIKKAATDIGIIFTVENHSILGGLGGLTTEIVTEVSPCAVHRIGFPDVFLESGDNEEIFRKYNLDAEGIAMTVEAKLKAQT